MLHLFLITFSIGYGGLTNKEIHGLSLMFSYLCKRSVLLFCVRFGDRRQSFSAVRGTPLPSQKPPSRPPPGLTVQQLQRRRDPEGERGRHEELDDEEGATVELRREHSRQHYRPRLHARPEHQAEVPRAAQHGARASRRQPRRTSRGGQVVPEPTVCQRHGEPEGETEMECQLTTEDLRRFTIHTIIRFLRTFLFFQGNICSKVIYITF